MFSPFSFCSLVFLFLLLHDLEDRINDLLLYHVDKATVGNGVCGIAARQMKLRT